MNEKPGSFYIILLSALLAVWIGLVIILSWVPPVDKDELAHHLAVPKLYLRHGAMYEMPDKPFSYYPMNLDLLYLVPLYFKNDIIPKFMHFAFALLTAGLIFHDLRKRLGLPYGLLGALLFLTVPIIAHLSTTAYVDLGLVFFSYAALSALFQWRASGFRPGYLVLAGVMTGLAMGTKYNGLLAALILSLLVPMLRTRSLEKDHPGFFKAAAPGLAFLLISFLIFSPWLIRNYHWTKNPVHPLAKSFFENARLPAGKPLLEKEKPMERTAANIFVFRRVVYREEAWQIALLPLRIFFQGRDNDPRYFDGKLNPFLLFFPLLAFCGIRRENAPMKIEKGFLLAFVLLYFFLAFFNADLRLRYLAPVIPPLIILCVLGIHKSLEGIEPTAPFAFKRPGLLLILGALVCCLAYNAVYIREQFVYRMPLPYLKGAVTRDEYIARFRPEHAALLYINRHLPADSRVMFVYLGGRGYYCERDYILGNEQLWDLFRNSSAPDQIGSKLKSRKVTHLLIYDRLLEQWAMNNLDAPGIQQARQFFLDHTERLYAANGFSVSALK